MRIVDVVPYVVGVVVSALLWYYARPQRIRRFPMSSPRADLPSWSDVPREFEIDLSGVRSRDDFMRALKPHFPVGPDHLNIWGPIYRAIGMQTCPIRIRFLGWNGFADRMPRYAGRLRSYLTDYERRHGRERLAVDYAPKAED
jgi:hypothetical protein